MGVKLAAASGGSVELVPTNTASNFTATLPAGTGTVVVNGLNGSLVSGTSVDSTSGTSIDFTGIPSWVKRITVMLSGVSTNGSSLLLVQMGSGSIASTGYVTTSARLPNGNAISVGSSTAGFIIAQNDATFVNSGHMALTLANASTNLWISSHSMKLNTLQTVMGGGSATFGGVIDRVRITTSNGTDTFDAGSINILYE